MSVSNYTPGNGCKYQYSKLKDRIYLVSEDHVKKIYIDNGEAYISGLTEAPLLIEGFNIEFKEDTSLDERYLFTKTLTISKKGYASYKDFQGRYYAIIETVDGTFYMINVDFPSKVTHTFNLSKDTNQTDFSLTSLSNYPTLRINYDFGSVPYECKGFNVSGIKGLKLCEKIRTNVSTVNNTIYTYGANSGVDERSFRTIEYLGESCTFQEAYDGDKVTDTITFDIGFDAYKTSWQYNLLEFIENLYSAIIESKGEEDIRYYSGFNHGLEPSYSIAANNGNSTSDIITITLVESSNIGSFKVDELTVTNNSSTSWRWIRKYGNHKTYECVEEGVAIYLVQEEVWANGTPTGRYKVKSGYENEFYYLNIVGTFDDEVTFYQPDCSCSSRPRYEWETLSIDEDYECDTAATKYYKEAQIVSYDCGETWEETGQYRRGNVYERNSPDCGYAEKWVVNPISEGYICDECYEGLFRWVDMDIATDWICEGLSKYFKQKEQVTYDSGVTWVDVMPPQYRKGDLYEAVSDSCGTMENEYLTIHVAEASPGKVNLVECYRLNSSQSSLYVSIDGGEWERVSVSCYVRAGQTARFKSLGAHIQFRNVEGTAYTSVFETYGNVMSLYYDDDFIGKTTIPTELSGVTQSGMYRDCTGLTNAEYLALPATTVYPMQYMSMFDGCTSMVKGPNKLPATTIVPYDYEPGTINFKGSYEEMFQGCASLTNAPIISASTFSYYTCMNMFEGCSSLTTVPTNMLPASVNGVLDGCFHAMFKNCSNLLNAPNIKIDSVGKSGCYEMFMNCTSLSSASFTIENSVGVSGCSRMFMNCESLMSLSNIKLKPTTAPKYCYYQMFSFDWQVASGNTHITTIPDGFLPATTLDEYCYYSMFASCTSLATVPSNLLPATIVPKYCYFGMFGSCDLTVAPDLPAAILTEWCYSQMFVGNVHLNYVKCLATDISASHCTEQWMNCTDTGTFVAASPSIWQNECYPAGAYQPTYVSDYVPTNWTIQNA